LVLPVHLIGAHPVRQEGPKSIGVHQITLTARVNGRHAKAGAEQAREQIGTVSAHSNHLACALHARCRCLTEFWLLNIEISLRDSICHLRVDGYVCTAVGDSDKALLATADQGCDLIVMDIAIPPLGGGEVSRAFRGGSRGGKTPIIIVTDPAGNPTRCLHLSSALTTISLRL